MASVVRKNELYNERINKLVFGYIRSACHREICDDVIELSALFFSPPIHFLETERSEAIKRSHLRKILEIEKNIVQAICYWHPGNPTDHKNLLKAVLEEWLLKDAFRNCIVESIKQCIRNNDTGTLKLMLNHCEYFHQYAYCFDDSYPARDKEMVEFVNLAIELDHTNCVKAVFEMRPILEPICLVNAIKYERWKFVELVYEELILRKFAAGPQLDGTQVIEHALKYDLVDIVEKCIKHKWYQVKEDDEERALQMNALKCAEIFNNQMFIKKAKELRMKEDMDWDDEDDGNWEDF